MFRQVYCRYCGGKSHGYLKRFLVNIMTQGHNHYPNIKAYAYTRFCNYFHECIKNKKESTTMRNRPTMGVLFYQRASPIYGPPVAGKMASLRIL